MSCVYLRNIHIDTPRRQIYARLGYNKHKTTMSKEQEVSIKNEIDVAVSYCSLQGVYEIIRIKENDGKKVRLSNDIVWESAKLSKMLSQSNSVILFAATAGVDIVKKRNLFNEQGEMTKAIIYDAVGSEMAEGAIDWIHKMLTTQYITKGKKVTKMRFSPGYGDLALDNQPIIFNQLNLKLLDMKISDSNILYPEKSVTAIAGIEE